MRQSFGSIQQRLRQHFPEELLQGRTGDKLPREQFDFHNGSRWRSDIAVVLSDQRLQDNGSRFALGSEAHLESDLTQESLSLSLVCRGSERDFINPCFKQRHWRTVTVSSRDGFSFVA